ncbi:MAG: hypothetical protein HXY34_10490 [Candidatus Thorarchaeota archaeon]|nr:hypothetical protein [Candidatus Thorarchaeota archaeon]
MKQVGTFELAISEGTLGSLRGPKKKIPVEVLIDDENTLVVLDCTSCSELLNSRLPGGILIPIASALKAFFEERGMRNTDVRVSGNIMRRTYRGVMDAALMPSLREALVNAVSQFSKKRKSSA